MIEIEISTDDDRDLAPATLDGLAKELRATCERFGIKAFVQVESTQTRRAYAGAEDEDDDDE